MTGSEQLEPGPTVGARGITFEHRIAVTALATAIAVLALASALFLYEQWRSERSNHIRARGHLAELVARELEPSLAAGDMGLARREATMFDVVGGVRHIVVKNPGGGVVIDYEPPGLGPPRGGELIDSRAQVVHDGQVLGQVAVTSESAPFSALLLRYLAVCGSLFFAAVAMALFMGRALAKRVVQPVNILSRAMREVTDSGDYSGRVPNWAKDEFGELTDSFNTLLAQLQANDRALHATMSDLVEARDAAQAANVLKSQFLANMSHEIRTPLNGVLAMAEIMALGDLAPNQRERVAVIRRSGEDLLAILNDILDLSKIEAGRMEIEDGEVSAEMLETKTIQAFAEVAAAKKNLKFKIEVKPAARGVRRGDPGRVQQILSCLVSNAIKFTGEGEVRVLIDGYGPGGGEGLRLTVADSGIGIAPEQMPLLFQKFSQADSSNTRRFGGTGLGLAISRELARLMHGTIEVDSEQGKGSTFTVTLPLTRVAAAPADTADLAAGKRAMRVLAAEDIPTNQLVLKTILQSFGVELEMVENGQLAVEAWRQHSFDLILMDIQMPVMDGIAATQAIRAEELAAGRPRTPIIAVSANALPHHAKTYLENGMDAHVGKPIELAKLQEAIERVAPAAPLKRVELG
ncbi:ATP-binding protein [Phenylobacterium montanum]|uniref:Sensory/regulatory protein RpfC n=1 Tax=Phenylobacterium montanum TaxID=2823693 RepID=A0A975FX90_9CAUL|nr:ATP-binding protein [Caulobacter sp. S6]QUD86617.1 response regulator [Caulobacter sp. S6]